MRIPEEFDIVWRVYPYLDLLQMSGLLSGVSVLASQRHASLSMEFVDGDVPVPYAVMELVVTQRSSGKSRNVVFDFWDREDRVSHSALQFADVYFKRQFGPHTASTVSSDVGAKIRPLGLTIPGFSRETWKFVMGTLYASLRSSESRSRYPSIGSLVGHFLDEANHWLGVNPTSPNLLLPATSKAPRIVFQPRLWDVVGSAPEVFDDANKDRIATVQILREAFGSADTIGLIHTAVARELAPQLQLTEKVSTSRYHEQLRSSLIAVNCVGLSGSLGWKLAEYLAAGNAIVSQPIEKELLAPLEANVHYLPYRSPAECVAQCRRLLGDPELAARMGKANRDYFLRWTRPQVHAMHLLEQAFA